MINNSNIIRMYMKIITIFRVLIVSLMVIFAQPVSCGGNMPMLPQAVVVDEDMSVEQKKELAEAALKSEVVVAEATKVMDQAQNNLLGSQNEDAQNVAAIIAQNEVIVGANQAINKLRAQLVKKVEGTSEGYFSQFVSGLKNIGTKLLAPFRAGYGYSEDEKENAPGIIVGLNAQKAKVIEKYVALTSTKKIETEEQAQLKKRYDAIIAQFDDAIYQQQLITGEKRSTAFKMGAAVGAAAGAAIAKSLVSKYLETAEGGPTLPLAPSTEPIPSTEPTSLAESTVGAMVEPILPSASEGGPALPSTEPTVVESTESTLPSMPLTTSIESASLTEPTTEPNTKGPTLRENIELYHPNIHAVIEAARETAKTVGETVQTGVKELTEAIKRVPASKQEEYLSEKYGSEASSKIEPTLQTIGETVQIGAKELTEAIKRSPEQKEYFAKEYGPEATKIISSKIEPALQTIKEKIKLPELPKSFAEMAQEEAKKRWEQEAKKEESKVAPEAVAVESAPVAGTE
jgi:hypothetical protein